MEDYNKYLELFDKKYNNELTGVEEKNFEKRLEEDNAFKVEFDKYMEMINSMHFGAAEITKKELDNIKSQLEAEGFFDKIPETELIPSNTTSKQKTAQVSKVIPSKNNRRLPWPLGIAASFLLLIGAYGYIATNYSNNALADTTSLYAARGVERGGEQINNFQQGEEALEKRHYKQAVTFFEAIPSSSEDYLEAQYFLAYSEYQLENYASAIELTRGMLQNTSVNIETRQKTEWLHIQSLLVNDQINSIDFKQLLSQLIIDEDHIFHSKAVALEKRLNSFWRKLIF